MSIDRIGLNSFAVGAKMGGAGKAPEKKVEKEKESEGSAKRQEVSPEAVLGFMGAKAVLGIESSSSLKKAFAMAESASPEVVARMTTMMDKFADEVGKNMAAVQKELGLSEPAAREVALKMTE
ncbi:MAG TPA: hypothetical protein PLG15_03235 [Candidatus Gastranaerophilaceae bacterium]|nr:hypothetical protein [Candidatus Gastranaerophilaceae bacterium]HPT41378.1 hypothetical protein [Candidatus Gastranaerophilaceae bacterium]